MWKETLVQKNNSQDKDILFMRELGVIGFVVAILGIAVVTGVINGGVSVNWPVIVLVVIVILAVLTAWNAIRESDRQHIN